MKNQIFSAFRLFFFAVLLTGCSTTKYVPEGSYLLDKTTIHIKDHSYKGKSLNSYLKQKPNVKTFGLWKGELNFYNLSGRDSTKWYNKILRNLGNPPVIYDSLLTSYSSAELLKAMRNEGYFNAQVDYQVTFKKRKASVVYSIIPGHSYKISNFYIDIQNDSLQNLAESSLSDYLIKPGKPVSQQLLDNERAALTSILRNKGYYKLSKTNFFFEADSSIHNQSTMVDVTMKVFPEIIDSVSTRYRIREVYIHTNYDPIEDVHQEEIDTLHYRGMKIIRSPKMWIKPFILADICMITPGNYYSDLANEQTFSGFNRLQTVKYCAIRYQEIQPGVIDCHIMISEAKNKVFSTDIEGTNSAGDLGAAVSVGFQHLNIAHGGEVFSSKVRGAYEHLFSLGSNKYYLETNVDAGLAFPRFVFPFLNPQLKRKINASSEVNLMGNFQTRPEYERVLFGASWGYRWNLTPNLRHSLDLLDLSYTYLPYKSPEFIAALEAESVDPLLKYSYENMLILRTGYSYYKSNAPLGLMDPNKSYQNKVGNNYSFRFNGEIAGNLLYGLSSLLNANKIDGGYQILGIRFAQYAKGVADFTYRQQYNERFELVYHALGGVAYPYGNLNIIPFERRFFAGGANGLRGWLVRTIGPGTYKYKSSYVDYINQTGDIKLDLSVEARSRITNLIHTALFVDAGNIWTIRDYQNQPGGLFDISKFYKEIAANCGVGLRFDFSFMVFRLDMGAKIYEPSQQGSEKWRIRHFDAAKDLTFHFAIGYPF